MVWSLSRCINTKFLYGISYATSRYNRCRFSMNDAICPKRVSFTTTSASLSPKDKIVCFLYVWQIGDCSGQFVDSRRVDRVGFPIDKHCPEITSDNGFWYYFRFLIHSDKN